MSPISLSLNSNRTISLGARSAVPITDTLIEAGGVTYGTYENPFGEESIWNTPIQPTASFVATNINVSVSACQHIWDEYIVKRVFRADPMVNVHNKSTETFCISNLLGVIYQIPLPNSYTNTNHNTNSIACFVEVDSLTNIGRISEGYVWQRCVAGGPAAQYASGTSALGSERDSYTITHPTATFTNPISVNAARFGCLGGVIRSGELTSAVGVPIPHTLRMTGPRSWWHYNAASPTPGYRWPALAADGNANGTYVGTSPNLVMGSLLGIPPATTIASAGIVTEPGKKLFNAAKTYGVYVVDSSSENVNTIFGIVFECASHSDSDLTVINEFNATYGVNLRTRWGSFHGWTGFEFDFHNDVCKIFNAMRVISNTSSSTPKG